MPPRPEVNLWRLGVGGVSGGKRDRDRDRGRNLGMAEALAAVLEELARQRAETNPRPATLQAICASDGPAAEEWLGCLLVEDELDGSPSYVGSLCDAHLEVQEALARGGGLG